MRNSERLARLGIFIPRANRLGRASTSGGLLRSNAALGIHAESGDNFGSSQGLRGEFASSAEVCLGLFGLSAGMLVSEQACLFANFGQ